MRFLEDIETDGLDCCRAVVVLGLGVKSKRSFSIVLAALERSLENGTMILYQCLLFNVMHVSTTYVKDSQIMSSYFKCFH